MDVDETQESLRTNSISCENIPELFLDKPTAKEHFTRFGKIKKFILNPKRLSCTVEYDSVESAENAMLNGNNFRGYEFKISFTQISELKTKSIMDDYVINDPDVQSELDAMSPKPTKTTKKRKGKAKGTKGKSAVNGDNGVPAGYCVAVIENYLKKTERFPQTTIKPVRMVPQKTIEMPAVNPKVLMAAKSEVELLSRKPARTAEERYQILDARDKYFRLFSLRNTDIKRLESTKGTCKDMCPEKERYFRETTCQVTVFEGVPDNPSQINHRTAIKQYSRSSADQETPLPHDLRTEEVLKTTMVYMLHRIMNLCDDSRVNVSDWFHFVWDRTRGIRKDITQQDACSLNTVELVEQCARFHIHCSARLVAEEPSVFDQKINTENLTKCLQTLKYQYNDLKFRNIFCKNEAEFRAYIVLLNLNDGNFLVEIKQLEEKLLQSKEIRFALNVYFAVESNNYVRFFQLVKETTYMNACILLRYFNQVRMRALNTIIRSYTPHSNVGINFSISKLTDILAFEDDESTIQYLEFHGLACNRSTNLVSIDRRNFFIPEIQFLLDRALNVVESKRTCSVAEAICGGPLPSSECFENHTPHCSFDENGLLKRDAFTAEDQNGEMLKKDDIFKVPKVSPPVSPHMFARSPMRLPQKDQTDSINIFGKSPSKVNPFLNKPTTSIFSPRPILPSTQPESEDFQMNVTEASTKPSPLAFGATPAFSPSNSIFGNQSIFGSNGSATSKSIFGSPMVMATPPSTGSLWNEFGSPAVNTPRTSETANIVSKFITPIAPTATTIATPPSTAGNLFSLIEPKIQSNDEKLQNAIADLQRVKNLQEEENRRKALEEKRFREEREARIKEQEAEKKRKEEEERQHLERMRKELERKKIEEEKMEQRLMKNAENRYDSMLNEIVHEITEELSERAYIQYVKIPEDVYNIMLEETLIEELVKIYRQEFLAYFHKTKFKYEVLLKYFNGWRVAVNEAKDLKLKLENLPCMFPIDTINLQPLPQQNFALKNMRQYLTGSSLEVKIPSTEICRKIDVLKEFGDLKIKNFRKVFWKLVISIPCKDEENSSDFYAFIDKWTTGTFGNQNDGKFLYFAEIGTSYRNNLICIRKVKGCQLIDESLTSSPKTVNYSDGIVYFTTITNLEKSKQRLGNILRNSISTVAVTIIFYMTKTSDQRMEATLAKLFDLSQEKNVIDYEIVFFYDVPDKTKNLHQVIMESLNFQKSTYLKSLLNLKKEIYDMEMQSATSFFATCLGDEFYKRVLLNIEQNQEFATKMQQFNCVIDLYNDILKKLSSVIGKTHQSVPNLSQEFNKTPINRNVPLSLEFFSPSWRSADSRRILLNFLESLKLKKLQNDNFESSEDFAEKLENFLQQNFNEDRQNLFDNCISQINNSLTDPDAEVADVLKSFNWLSVLLEIFVQKFNEMFMKFQNRLPSEIYYNINDLNDYLNIPWWLNDLSPSTHPGEPQAKKSRLSNVSPISQSSIDETLSRSAKLLEKLDKHIENYKKVAENTRQVSRQFDLELYKFEETVRLYKNKV